MREKWICEIEGFEQCKDYKIREDGNVISFKKGEPKILKGLSDTKGYLYVCLGKRYPKIHRLVALAFIPNLDNKPQVNHIDGNKKNNNISNLEWVTNGENQKHAFKLGLNKPHKGESNYQYSGDHKNCKSVRQLDLDGNEITVYKSIAIAKRSIGNLNAHIGEVCNGKANMACGYKWEFVE